MVHLVYAKLSNQIFITQLWYLLHYHYVTNEKRKTWRDTNLLSITLEVKMWTLIQLQHLPHTRAVLCPTAALYIQQLTMIIFYSI